MSNMGLEAALQPLRHPHAARTGGRQVRSRKDAEDNAALGGEQSGHILFPHLATTGDGLLTALVVLDIVRRRASRSTSSSPSSRCFRR